MSAPIRPGRPSLFQDSDDRDSSICRNDLSRDLLAGPAGEYPWLTWAEPGARTSPQYGRERPRSGQAGSRRLAGKAGRVQEIRRAVGGLAGHDLGKQLADAGGVLEAVTAVPAGDDHARVVLQAPDEELLVGRVRDHARDDLRRTGIKTRQGPRDAQGQLVDVGVGVDVAVHFVGVDPGAAGAHSR